MKLTPDRSDAISAAIREIGNRVHLATLASDTAAARYALGTIRDAVLEAAELINDAEQATRREALAQLEKVA